MTPYPIYSLFSVEFLTTIVLAISAFTVSFYFPGLFFISFFKIKHVFVRFLLENILGFVIWAYQGYIFGSIGMRWLSYVYLGVIFCGLLFFRKKIKKTMSIFEVVRMLPSVDKIVFILICFGLVIQMIPVFGSGILYPEGVRFFGVNSRDGIMHMAYIQSISEHFPPLEPGAVGLKIVNYHYWSDLVVADLVRIWHLPITHLFFQLLPIYISLLTGITMYSIVRIWGGSRRTSFLALFFLYCGGEATYIFMLIFHKSFGFYTPSIDNGVGQFLNMPNASAKMVFLGSFIPLYYWITTKEKKWGILSIIFFASLIGFKVYYGLFALLGFFFLSFGELANNLFLTLRERQITMIKMSERIGYQFLLLSILLLTTLFIYIPVNGKAGGLFFAPLEWPKIFLGAGGIDLNDWWLRKQVYEQARSFKGLFLIHTIAIVIGLLCIHGTRLIGFFSSKKLLTILGWRHMFFFLPGLIIFQFLGLYTLQISGGFNVFNFFVVTTVILSLFSAFFLEGLLKRKTIIVSSIVFLIFVLTIPRVINDTISNVKNYFDKTAHSDLYTNSELLALSFIKQHTSKLVVVQSHPNNPIDVFVPYVPFFTDRFSYLSGEGLLETHNQPVIERKNILTKLFAIRDQELFFNLIKQKEISIIYLKKTPQETLPFTVNQKYFKIIYENQSALVLERVI